MHATPSCCLKQLIDLPSIRALLESYHRITGISCTLLDTDQQLLLSVGWPDICTQYHRAYPASAQRCQSSNATMLRVSEQSADAAVLPLDYSCENGMIYSLLPVMVDGVHAGTLVAGKYFYEDALPDQTVFLARAEQFGYDPDAYLATLQQVPCFNRDQITKNLLFLKNLVAMLTELGLANRRLSLQSQELQAVSRFADSANRALRLLSASNQTLLRCTCEEELLFQVCRIAVETGGYKTAWVGLAQQDTEKTVVPLAWHGITEEQLNRVPKSWGEGEHGNSAIGTAIRMGTVQIYQNILHDPTLGPWHETARAAGHQAAIAIPLSVRDEIIAALAIYAPEADAFQQSEVDLLKELALDLAFGIQTIRDRRAYEKAREHVHKLAYYDSLTRLPNQYMFMEQLDRSIAAASTGGTTFSLFLLDINHLREINETYGHVTGDQILVRVAGQLQKKCYPACFVARFGGDFAIICDRANQDTALTRAESLLADISQPFHLSGHYLKISGNIGMALYPADGTTASELLSKVDLATSRAKAAGGGFCFYQPEMGEQLARTVKIAQRLERAIGKDLLQLYYQPKIDLLTGQLVGAEALLRWNDAYLGWISPLEFVAIAEARGMMRELGGWVLRSACQQIRQWQDADGLLLGKIAVNISGCQLEDEHFIAMLTSVLEDTGVSPTSIELELTESVLMSDPERIVSILNELKNQGFSLAIDDFGTGYSSLAYLKRFPVDTLKIDRAFVRDMLEDQNDHAIVATVVAMAQQLGLTTVAEGIEEVGQHKTLLKLGCLQGQGFHFGRPQPAADFYQEWLNKAVAEQ